MKGIPSTAQRGIAGVLFAAMLTLGVMKAQGCQRPVDESAESNAVAEQPNETTSSAAGVGEEPVTAGDAGGDAGAGKDAAPPSAPRPMFPATKSGMAVDVIPESQPNAAPQQQKSE